MTDTNPTDQGLTITPADLGAPVAPTPATTGDHVATPTVPDSHIWFPNQRVIRTAVQVIVSAAVVLGLVVTVAPQVITAVASVLPASWVAWLTGAVAVLAGISAALSRVMAIPAVDAFLVHFGAGSTTKSAAKRAAQSDQVG